MSSWSRNMINYILHGGGLNAISCRINQLNEVNLVKDDIIITRLGEHISRIDDKVVLNNDII